MGIKCNFELLTQCGKEVSFEEFKNKKIAIDMMTYIIRYFTMLEKKDNLDKWFEFIVNFLKSLMTYDITCICVFDGVNKPKEKNICIKKRKQATKKYKQEYDALETQINALQYGHYENLQEVQEQYFNLCKLMKKAKVNSSYPSEKEIKYLMILIKKLLKIDVYIADGEAESLCCWLVKNGKADYVLSEDSDVLLYSVDNFLTRYSRQNKARTKIISIEEILQRHKISYEELFVLCILMGTDYNKSCISFNTALRRIKNENIEEIISTIEEPNFKRMKELFTPCGIYTDFSYTEDEYRDFLKFNQSRGK